MKTINNTMAEKLPDLSWEKNKKLIKKLIKDNEELMVELAKR
tara:strand:+ start:1123 stop:1248 length:126 start_codon:yes stop_codon:yes gene_type:complete